ncbi:TetR/AcrR family transcriptional regulator C-terminal domain-containing protein [Devosia sp.]|uniref:TetR/AcrR family transcriptional regulator n=1 Tax=Devosia sp. TaxID=1871048 RepID=UPI00260302B1|nr:TetR/AcrR family transcriptional regulator C-terminal domain-containing protein [Devosia sp.]
MSLLWASHSRAIGRTGMSINDFVDAGISLAQQDGVAALSVRNIASRLGVRAMAMYTVVPSKQTLIALMVDKAYRGLYPDGSEPNPMDWRAGMRDVARANLALHNAHPWLHELMPVRSPMGPYEARKHELELRVVDKIGLTDFEMDQSLALVRTHVIHSSRIDSQLLKEREESGLDDSEWWLEAMPVLERVYDPRRFPLIVRVGTAANAERDEEFWGQEIFEFGLERILDGIASVIATRDPK